MILIATAIASIAIGLTVGLVIVAIVIHESRKDLQDAAHRLNDLTVRLQNMREERDKWEAIVETHCDNLCQRSCSEAKQ